MATDAIRERILQHCEASLLVVNGIGVYQLPIRTVGRGQGDPSNLDELPSAYLQEGVETVVDGPDPLITRILPITVIGWCLVDDETTPLATVRNRLQQDIETAILADQTQGGLAVNTRYTGSRIPDDREPGSLGSVEVSFEIHYRTRYNNPVTGL